MSEILNLTNIYKSYEDEKVLNGINLSLKEGESIAITGHSGSGKSTLLHIIGLLDDKSSGHMSIFNNDVDKLSEIEKNNIRKNYLGFVYQFHYLINELNIFDNIKLPYLLKFNKENNDKIKYVMDRLGILNKSKNYPSELSGGQRQRAAICRAIVTSPKLLIADEPTGNLDSKNANLVKTDLFRLIESEKMSLILSTHDENLANNCGKQLRLN